MMNPQDRIRHLENQIILIGDELAQHIEGETPDFEFHLVGGVALHHSCGTWTIRDTDPGAQRCPVCH